MNGRDNPDAGGEHDRVRDAAWAERIASIIAHEELHASTREQLAEAFARRLGPRFDRARFLAACGVAS